MNLISGLAVVDEVTGGKRVQQLADGWMGWESQGGRRLRALGVRLLVAAATRLAPAQLQARVGNGRTAEVPAV